MRTQTRVPVRKRARKGSFVAGTGLMGATEPGQRVTCHNAHELLQAFICGYH